MVEGTDFFVVVMQSDSSPESALTKVLRLFEKSVQERFAKGLIVRQVTTSINGAYGDHWYQAILSASFVDRSAEARMEHEL